MSCVSLRASSGLRLGLIGLASLALLAGSVGHADAKWFKRKQKQTEASASYEPRYAHIVVDANTGDVLDASNADSLRHPASLTKMMTLYLLFERLEAGKIRLDTPMEVSAHAAAQAPSKLGLRPGQTIAVEDAIKALVTKSANDVAAVIAEALGGSEDDFAKLMTRKARALGMSRTVYHNASGLPDNAQVTTARDQVLLGIALQERFPKYYRYFSTSQFVFRGHAIRNHNRLLGRIEGVDGIKTGYTRASGFNLVTSMRRGDRHIVAAVFGGRTGGQRDARMRELIEKRIVEASVKRTAPKIAEAAEPRNAAPKKTRVASADNAAIKSEALAAPTPRPEPVTTAAIPMPPPAPQAGSTEPIKPHLVKTLSVKAGTSNKVASMAPLALLSPQPVTSEAHAHLGSQQATLPPPPPGARPGILGVLPAKMAYAAETSAPAAVAALPARSEAAVPASAAKTPAHVRSGWIIQIGAYEDENDAKQRLSSVRGKAGKVLQAADPFTERFVKGEKTFYRARFAGFKQQEAEAACRQLKRNDIACMAIRN